MASQLFVRRTVSTAAILFACHVGAQAAPVAKIAAKAVNPVVTLELEAPKDKLLAGETMQLEVNALDAVGSPVTNPRLTYKVLPASVASVKKGILTAKKAGMAQVTVVSGKVVSDPVEITVNAVGRIDVSPAGPIGINAGDSVVFRAQAYDVAGVALPNDDYPDVPLVWKSSNKSAVINQNGALVTSKPGATAITVLAGKAKTAPLRVLIGKRDAADSTRVFLTGQPVTGLKHFFVTIDKIEVAPEVGAYQTLLTGGDIDALVGQPVDMLSLVNRRILLGTGFLTVGGDYRKMKITYSTEEGAHYFVRSDDSRVDLIFENIEDSVSEFASYLFVTEGYPLNSILEFRASKSAVQLEDGSFAFKPNVDTSVMDDEELAEPIGSLVGQVAQTGGGDIWVSNVDDGSGTIINYFGTLDSATGAFRIGQLPAGSYVLHVAIEGFAQKDITGIVISAGQDTTIAEPISVATGS